jgi:hypothetical protein
MKKIFFFAFLFLSINSIAQYHSRPLDDSSYKKTNDTNFVVVHKDPRIDLLIKKQIQINEETSRDARRIGKGFRLLVINTSKRDEAVAAKTKVYSNFPELKAYLIYQSPYFKLKVGNFKERKEAEEYQKKFTNIFPKGVFIMNDIIEVKLEKDREP